MYTSCSRLTYGLVINFITEHTLLHLFYYFNIINFNNSLTQNKKIAN